MRDSSLPFESASSWGQRPGCTRGAPGPCPHTGPASFLLFFPREMSRPCEKTQLLDGIRLASLSGRAVNVNAEAQPGNRAEASGNSFCPAPPLAPCHRLPAGPREPVPEPSRACILTRRHPSQHQKKNPSLWTILSRKPVCSSLENRKCLRGSEVSLVTARPSRRVCVPGQLPSTAPDARPPQPPAWTAGASRCHSQAPLRPAPELTSPPPAQDAGRSGRGQSPRDATDAT